MYNLVCVHKMSLLDVKIEVFQVQYWLILTTDAKLRTPPGNQDVCASRIVVEQRCPSPKWKRSVEFLIKTDKFLQKCQDEKYFT